MTATGVTHVDPYLSEGTSPPPSSAEYVPGYTGLRCRACGTPHDTGPVFVCSRCFGPLEPIYDLAAVAARITAPGDR